MSRYNREHPDEPISHDWYAEGVRKASALVAGWGAWVCGDWDPEQPACVRCHAAMSLRDGCEWSDFPELNLCDDCTRSVLEGMRPNGALTDGEEGR